MSSTQWWSRRAVGIHVTAAIVVPGCIALTWWQATRALGGNELSWAYMFEWPIFAAYAVYMWWRLLHEPPVQGDTTSSATTQSVSPERHLGHDPQSRQPVEHDSRPHDPHQQDPHQQEEEAERLAYNQYLAELSERGAPKRW